MKKNYIYLIFIIFLSSCASMKEAGKVIRNEKVSTTDEFLVKRKEPLVLPPDYNIIPEPESLKKSKQNEDQKIRKILKAPLEKSSGKSKSLSIEEKILENIRK